MKQYGTFLRQVIIASVALSVTIHGKTIAQNKKQVSISDTVLQKSPAPVVLKVGMTVSYKTLTSKSFQKSRITGITDSTISLYSKKTGAETILKKDLATLRIHSSDKRFAGTTLIALGTAGILVGVVAQGLAGSPSGSGETDHGATAAIAGGIVAIAGGIILQQPKKIDLSKPWQVRPGQATPANSQQQYVGFFNVALGVGIGNTFDGSSARIFSLEPSYRFRPNFAFGLRIEGLLPTGERTNLTGGTFTLNGQYYLSATKFRPFVGGGFGVFAFGDAMFGFYPRAGFVFGRLSLTADYNIISVSSTTPAFVGPTSSQVTGQPVIYYTPVTSPVSDQITKYLGVRIGFNLRK